MFRILAPNLQIVKSYIVHFITRSKRKVFSERGSAFMSNVKTEKVKWARIKIALNLSCNVKKLKVGNGCKRNSLNFILFKKKQHVLLFSS